MILACWPYDLYGAETRAALLCCFMYVKNSERPVKILVLGLALDASVASEKKHCYGLWVTGVVSSCLH